MAALAACTAAGESSPTPVAESASAMFDPRAATRIGADAALFRAGVAFLDALARGVVDNAPRSTELSGFIPWLTAVEGATDHAELRRLLTNIKASSTWRVQAALAALDALHEQTRRWGDSYVALLYRALLENLQAVRAASRTKAMLDLALKAATSQDIAAQRIVAGQPFSLLRGLRGRELDVPHFDYAHIVDQLQESWHATTSLAAQRGAVPQIAEILAAVRQATLQGTSAQPSDATDYPNPDRQLVELIVDLLHAAQIPAEAIGHVD